MAGTAPGWPPAGRQPAPPAGRGSGSGRRTPLIAVLVGLVVFVAAGVGSFAVAGGFGGGVGQSVSCGNQRCIPSLRSGDVIDALKAKGYECLAASGSRWECALETGTNRYSMRVSSSFEDPDQVSSVHATVSYPEESQPDSVILSYLSWSASLPYANDPVTVADVTAWLTQQVEGGQDANVAVGDYRYALQASQPGSITLGVSSG